MKKIYTPKGWNSIFSYPSIIIDDDGKIYDAEGFYAVIQHAPIGLIDYNSGYIYGPDYAKFSAAPIGKIEKTSDAVTHVYGQDYAKFGAVPILYIDKQKRIYTDEEYHKLFGSYSARIQSDSKVFSLDDNINNQSITEDKEKKEASPSESNGALLGIPFFIIVLFVIIGFGWLLSGGGNVPTFFMIFGSSMIVALLLIKRKQYTKWSTYTLHTVVAEYFVLLIIYCVTFILDLFQGESIFRVIGLAFASVFALIGMAAPPAIICSSIIWFVKKKK